MLYTEKAVDFDKLVKVDSTVGYSSSTVEVLGIFRQIKLFWQQLAWPDAESTRSFEAKITNDICCKCSLHYSNKICEKFDRTAVTHEIFRVTKEVIFQKIFDTNGRFNFKCDFFFF